MRKEKLRTQILFSVRDGLQTPDSLSKLFAGWFCFIFVSCVITNSVIVYWLCSVSSLKCFFVVDYDNLCKNWKILFNM